MKRFLVSLVVAVALCWPVIASSPSSVNRALGEQARQENTSSVDGQGIPQPTSTETETPTPTETGTATPTDTVVPTTSTPTNTRVPTKTKTPTRTRTPTKTATPRPTKTSTPTVRQSQISVTVSCRTDVETIRITNTSNWKIRINTIGTLYNAGPNEPFMIDRLILGGQSFTFTAGTNASYGKVLTNGYIFTNEAFEKDGVRIKTSIGDIVRKCPEAPKERWIEVNLSQQRLWAWEGNQLIATTLVSTGKPGYDTPTGTFYILTRYIVQDMAGCIPPDPCYNVPAVPYVQYFTDRGHALHGAYWHNSFGTVRSHGCINLPVPFSAWLWDWATYGTRLVIHY